MPASVVEAVVNHLTNSYVQLGAGYPASNRATDTVRNAHVFVRDIMMNGYGILVLIFIE